MLEIKLNEMSALATKTAGIRNFKKIYAEYVKGLTTKNTIYSGYTTDFEGQPMELDSSGWRADDYGVTKDNGIFEEMACCHPIMPVERLVNIDTGIEKLKLAYSKGKRWREIIVDKKTIASTQSIINLADNGIMVNSDNAKALVKYLHDMEHANFSVIPEKKSVSRLGFVPHEGFSPYVDGLIFDGDANFKHIFEAISNKGSYDKWLEVAREIRQTNTMARIVLATSFASVLVGPMGALPFFLHLWGGESGTGKTVALMLAASVWASPDMGRYIQTFNSTAVGREKLASFLNHLPLCIDELQLANRGGRHQFNIYELAEGVGRTRGTKTGGIDQTPTWANAIITTGETPITALSDGAGAVNRVIEVECSSSQKIIEDGHRVSGILKQNYGFAGKQFVEYLYSGDTVMEQASLIYKEAFKAFASSDTTDKQAGSAALIFVADVFATKWIFKDDRALEVNDIARFLASKASVSAGERGYRYMLDWVTQNANKLKAAVEQGDVYGIIEDDYAYIIGTVFRRAAEDGGFSSTALLSWLKSNNKILTRGRRNTRGKRINGVLTECVALKLEFDNENEDCDDLGELIP